MITVGLYYDVIPEKADLFEAKFRDVLAALGSFPGHKVSDLYRKVEDPYSYAILSEWDDLAAFQEFVRSDGFRDVTRWGREEVLRSMPRHKVYPRADDLGRPGA
jgi:heme-degrading monooxygenase HmoA